MIKMVIKCDRCGKKLAQGHHNRICLKRVKENGDWFDLCNTCADMFMEFAENEELACEAGMDKDYVFEYCSFGSPKCVAVKRPRYEKGVVC